MTNINSLLGGFKLLGLIGIIMIFMWLIPFKRGAGE